MCVGQEQIDASTDVPVNALCSQAGRCEDFLNITLPVGRFKFTEPAVHAVRLIIACLHQLYQTLLQNIRPVGEQMSDYSLSYRTHLCSCVCLLAYGRLRLQMSILAATDMSSRLERV